MLAQSTAVFRGRVTVAAYRPGADPFAGGPNQRATFQVDNSWKGPATRELVVVSGGMCGHHFQPGQEWVIFAYTYPGDLYAGELATNVCSANLAFAAAPPAVVSDYLALLGPGTPIGQPLPTQMPRVGAGGGAERLPLLAVGMVAILLAGLVSRRVFSGRTP